MVVVLCLVQFVDVFGVTVVVTALPSMLAGVSAPASQAGLVVTGYAMFFGGLLMLGARAGDRFGHRRVLLWGLVAFGAASVLGATAGSVVALVTARCLQGAAAAASVPAALRLLSAAAPGDEARRRALAAWSATGAAAGAGGLLLGGLLTQWAGWPAVFWMDVPLAAVLIAGVLAAVPDHQADGRPRLDAAGAALLTAAVMGLVLGASLLERPSQRAAGAAIVAAGAVLLAGFARVERAVAHPLLPAAAARHRRLRTGALASGLNTATTSSVVTLATLHLQDDRGVGPGAAGLRLLPFSLCVVAGAAAAAPVLARRPPRTVIGLGLTIIAAGDAALLALPVSEALLPACVGLSGLGIGVSSVAATTLGMQVPDALQGTASGLLNTLAQLGAALGIAVVLLVASITRGTGVPLAGAPLGWAAAAALAAAGAAAVVGLRRRAPGPAG
ncbi:MFS transporter [Baekduia soli]|uniref:MFS transporter n=1 Tax=Baekduia soli TaxID=496014 RepID=A0A5B8UCP0_9ACTN|nr:MFS transporter [Baekduia soli]